MGPRCPGVTTVEVAYRLQLVAAAGPGHYQVLIPEPNFWSPERPFRYEGPVEFLRQGQVVGTVTVSIGLRMGDCKAAATDSA